MNDAVRHHLDKREITDLLSWRALGADRFDVELMRACHPLDATDNHGTYQGSMHGFIDELERRTAEGPPCLAKQHIVTNVLIKERGPGELFAESYHVAHEVFLEPRGQTDYHIGGRYLDTFRKIGDRWQIQHRDIVYDWSRVMPASAQFAKPDQLAALRGTRDVSDPLYQNAPSWRGALPSAPSRIQDSTIMDDAVQQLLDKQAIAEVLYRRARAGDRADAELAHTCYHPGATERHGLFDGLATEFIDVVSFTRPKPGTPMKIMLHVVTNILVEFSRPDRAFVESYHVAYMTLTNGNDSIVGGRYLDTFENREGKWAIVHRDVIFDWSREEPETEKFWDKHPALPFLYGKRGADDPLYAYAKRGQ